MEKRVNELKNEMKKLEEEVKVFRDFMFDQRENIPTVVLDALREKTHKLDIAICDCELRLKSYK